MLLVMVYIIMGLWWCVIGDGLYYHGAMVCYW